MARFQAQIAVRLKVGVNDPQGLTVRSSLHALDFAEVDEVRIGKLIELTLAASDPAEARRRAEAMCEALLANPVIETYEIEGVTRAEQDEV